MFFIFWHIDQYVTDKTKQITREELQTKFAVVTDNDKASKVNDTQFNQVILMLCNERNIEDFEQREFDNMCATFFQSLQKHGHVTVEDLYKAIKRGLKRFSFGGDASLWDVIGGLTMEFQSSRKGREWRKHKSIMTAQDLIGNSTLPNGGSKVGGGSKDKGGKGLSSINESRSGSSGGHRSGGNKHHMKGQGKSRSRGGQKGGANGNGNNSNNSNNNVNGNLQQLLGIDGDRRKDYIDDDPLKAGSSGLTRYGKGGSSHGPGGGNRNFGRKFSYGKITRVFTRGKQGGAPGSGTGQGGASGSGNGDQASNEELAALVDALKRQEQMLYRVYSQISFLQEQIRGKHEKNDSILDGIKNIEYLKSTLQSILGMSLSALKDDLLDLFESSSMSSASQVALGINNQLSRMNGTLRWASDLLSRNSIEEFNSGIGKLEDLISELTTESKSFFGNAIGDDGNENELTLDLSPIMKELESVKHNVSTLNYYLNDNIVQRLSRMEDTVISLFGKIMPVNADGTYSRHNQASMVPRSELSQQLSAQRNNFERQIKQQKLKIQELQKAVDLQRQLTVNERKEIEKEREKLRGSIVRVSQQEAVIAELRTELKKRLAKSLFTKELAKTQVEISGSGRKDKSRDDDSDDSDDSSDSDEDLNIVSRKGKYDGKDKKKGKGKGKGKSKSKGKNKEDEKVDDGDEKADDEEDGGGVSNNLNANNEFESIEAAYNYIMESGYSIIYGKGTLKELKQIETIINSRVAERRTRKFEKFLQDRVVNEKEKVDKKEHFEAWQDEIEKDELPDFLRNREKNDVELENELGFGWNELLRVYRENTYLKTKLAFNEMEKTYLRESLDELKQPIVIGVNVREAEKDIINRIKVLSETFKERLVELRDLNFRQEFVRKQLAFVDKYRLQIYRDLKKEDHERRKEIVKEKYNINKDRVALQTLMSKWKHEIPKEKEEIIKMKDELSKTMRAYTKKLHETTILKKEFEAKKEMTQNEITNEMINERVNKHIETYKVKIQGSIRAEMESKHKKEINKIKSQYNEKLTKEMNDINEEWKSQIGKFQNIITRYKDEQDSHGKQLDRVRKDMEESEIRAANAIKERALWEGKYYELKKNFDSNEKRTDELYNEIQKIQEAWRNEQMNGGKGKGKGNEKEASKQSSRSGGGNSGAFTTREVRSGSKVIVQATRLHKRGGNEETVNSSRLRHRLDTLQKGFNEKEKRCKDYERRLGEVETQLGRTIEELNISKMKNVKLEKEIEDARNEFSLLNDKLVSFDALAQVSEQALDDIKKLNKSKHSRLVQEENQLRWDFTTWYAHKNHCLRKFFFMIEEWFLEVFWRHERTVAHYSSGSFMEAQLKQILQDTWLEVRIQSHCFTRWFGQLNEEKEKELFYAKDFGNEERYVWKNDIRKHVSKQRPGLIDRYYKQEVNEREQRRYDYWQRHPDAFILFEFVNKIYAEKHQLSLEQIRRDIDYMKNKKLQRITTKHQNSDEYKAISKKMNEKSDLIDKKAKNERHKTQINVNDIVNTNDPLSLPDDKLKQRVKQEEEKKRKKAEKERERLKEKEKLKEKQKTKK